VCNVWRTYLRVAAEAVGSVTAALVDTVGTPRVVGTRQVAGGPEQAGWTLAVAVLLPTVALGAVRRAGLAAIGRVVAYTGYPHNLHKR